MKNYFVVRILSLSVLLGTIYLFAGCSKHTESIDIGASTTVSVPTNFDSARWKRNFNFDREMLYPTAKNGLVDRFTEAQVLDVLGEPDARKNNVWCYVVQQKKGGIKYLLLQFVDGRMTRSSETFEPSEPKKQSKFLNAMPEAIMAQARADKLTEDFEQRCRLHSADIDYGATGGGCMDSR